MEGKEGEGRERKNLWICYPQQKNFLAMPLCETVMSPTTDHAEW